MQRSATFTGPGMALSPAAQRRTVRSSTSSCFPASTCDQPSAAIAAANSVGVILGADRVQRDLGGASALGHLGGGAADVGLAVSRQHLGGVKHTGLLRAGGAELEAGLLERGVRQVAEVGRNQDGGCVAHIHFVGPLALTVNHKNEVQHEMH